MDYTKKITELRGIINERLLPLIDNNYIYLDLPYYTNIGDLLIWKGTLNFLSKIKYKCLYSTDIYNYREKKINENAIVILQGGGNWGDLWIDHHIFRKRIIESYPKNKVIVFPQSIFYQNESNMLEDIKFYDNYPNVIICTRDNKSYDIMRKNFKNNKILLVPDMAFFIDVKFKPKKTDKILFAKRTDKELSLDEDIYKNVPTNAKMHDWPTMEIDVNNLFPNWIFNRINSVCERIDRILGCRFSSVLKDLYWKKFLMKYYINIGVDYLSDYHEIYSTRLHISILSLLMKKQLYIIDNNYNKTLNLIRTWFSEEEIRTMIK